MTIEERNKFLKVFFKSCEEVLETKGRDYTPDGIAFSDVIDTANDIGITPEKVLWIAMKKHISAVKSYVKYGRLESEPIKNRLIDIANYAALIAVLLETKK